MSDDPLEIPDFLRRSKEGKNMSKASKIEVVEPTEEERGEITTPNDKEVRPSKEQFLKAANEIDEIDVEIEKVHASVEAKIADLNTKRNAASEVVRKYLGRKR